MDFVETEYKIETQEEQIGLFNQYARTYQNDFFSDSILNSIRKNFLAGGDLRILWQEVKRRYRREEGEQILRPSLFWRTCGDCDDQYIFFCAFFLACGFSENEIFTCEVKQNSEDDFYVHIFCAVEVAPGKLFSLDALPHSVFGVVPYAKNLLHVQEFAKA